MSHLGLMIGKICLLVFVTGCASYTAETKEIRALYLGQKYKQSLEKLEASSLKDSEKDRLIYLLEKASILDKLGQRQIARKLLNEADSLVEKLKTLSVSRTATSFIMNDSSMDYEGEDYEKVAIHTVMALSFLEDNELRSARVEARRINSQLDEINKDYDKNQKNKYSQDAFALYLSAMIWEALGEFDSAIIDYRKALNLYESSYVKFYNGTVPDSLVKAYYKLTKIRGRTELTSSLTKKYPNIVKRDSKSNVGELVVIHEVGNISIKTQKEFIFPFGKQVVRFSFPTIMRNRHRSYGFTGVEIAQSNVKTPAENLQDLNSIAYHTLEDRRLRMIAKQGARLLLKGQAVEQAYEKGGPLAGLAANIFTAVTETADTRSWTLLPSAYYVTRLQLEPGEYSIKAFNAGRLTKIKKVKVVKNRMSFLRSY